MFKPEWGAKQASVETPIADEPEVDLTEGDDDPPQSEWMQKMYCNG
jgi:hypothetical protein